MSRMFILRDGEYEAVISALRCAEREAVDQCCMLQASELAYSKRAERLMSLSAERYRRTRERIEHKCGPVEKTSVR